MFALLLAGLLSACASTAPPVQDDAARREALLNTVWQTITERHVDPPPPGWQDARARHRDAVLGAPPLAQDPEGLWAALDGLAAEWRDAHTRVEGPRDIARQTRHEQLSLGHSLRRVQGQWVAFRVEPDSPAHAQGLRDGMALLTWNGEPPDGVWARLQATARRSSTPQATELRQLRQWLQGPPGSQVHSVWQRAEGAGVSASTLALNLARRVVQRLPSWRLTQRASGVAVLQWSQFAPVLEAPLVRAIAGLGAQSPDTLPGLILDLRGNGGGSFAMTQRLASAFLATPQPGPILGRKGELGQPSTLAGQGLYAGPLLVLVDSASASGAELLARNLQAVGRAKVLGETSCGCLLAVSRHLALAPDARLAVSERHIRWPDGRVEGRGVLPDLVISPSLAGLRAGQDEVLAHAEQLLVAAQASAH